MPSDEMSSIPIFLLLQSLGKLCGCPFQRALSIGESSAGGGAKPQTCNIHCIGNTVNVATDGMKKASRLFSFHRFRGAGDSLPQSLLICNVESEIALLLTRQK